MTFFGRQIKLREYSNQLILLSFLLIIVIGALLLSLPACSGGLSAFQALFTATSVTCVTGLEIVDTSQFPILGQLVIMILIQIGGLGLMTLSFFLVTAIYKQLGIDSTSVAKDALNLNSFAKIREFVTLVIKVTFGTELIGSIILFWQFRKYYPLSKAIFTSIFYSISAFCNSGVTMHPESLTVFSENTWIVCTTQILTILGGFGFYVFYEIISAIKIIIKEPFEKKIQKNRKLLSLHTKIVIKASMIVTIAGTLFFLAIEKHNLFANQTWLNAFFHSLFYNISLRSSGFMIFDIQQLTDASLFFSIICMLIGAAPGSTGGGVKITTFTLFIATLISIIKGRSHVEISSRTISQQQVYRCASIFSLLVLWIISSTFLLLLIEQDHQFLPLFFETCSSISNVGLSMGITQDMSRLGQILLMINMIAGRIGIMTFIFAIKQKPQDQRYKYPTEKLILG